MKKSISERHLSVSARSKALASARSAYLSRPTHCRLHRYDAAITSIARDRQLFDDRKRNGDHLLTPRGQAEQRSLQVCPIRTISVRGHEKRPRRRRKQEG